MDKLIRVLLVFTCLSCLGVSAVRSEVNESGIRGHEESDIPSNVRYEFVQSHIAASNTFKIDKYEGNVYQLVKDKNENLDWQLISRLKHPLDIQKDNQVNYQLFTSGIACRFTFLLNVWTGAAWQLAEDKKKEELFWDPIIGDEGK